MAKVEQDDLAHVLRNIHWNKVTVAVLAALVPSMDPPPSRVVGHVCDVSDWSYRLARKTTHALGRISGPIYPKRTLRAYRARTTKMSAFELSRRYVSADVCMCQVGVFSVLVAKIISFKIRPRGWCANWIDCCVVLRGPY